ncbi:hypothetical protein [Vulgatibacter incomptus]|uniref:Phage protein n=1 Tax=Vulgatibacter incomptus TaxID=1391653 RepID=A0A0K1PIY5_9BACT|nr:hypothetical protein [Vulgatibacter incomptus]AKU93069.1 Phage protein [Vulgatibacter incomptus]
MKLPSLVFGLCMAVAAALPIACSSGGDGGGGDPGGAGGGVGCQKNEDCSGGLVCIDGTCTGCKGDGDCGRAERCNASSFTCEFREGWGDECTAHSDCNLGLACAQGRCMPPEQVVDCGGKGQCPEGMRCNRPLNVCEEDLGCYHDEECLQDEICNVGTGACERRCTLITEEDICAAREYCYFGRCVECIADEDCKLGLSCNVAAGRCAGAQTCFTDRDCSAGLVCNRSTKSCTTAPPPCIQDSNCLPDEYCDMRRRACTLRSCQADQDSPNGSQAEAKVIGAGERGNLVVCAGEEKWYRLQLLRGDRINIRVETDILAANGFKVQLRDGQGNILTEDPFLLDATVGVDGTYFLRVRTDDIQARYALSILVAKGVPCDDDGFKGNDSPSHAGALTPGDYLNLRACPGVPDWFVMEVPAGRTAAASLVHDPLKGLLDLFLMDSDGHTLLAADQGIQGEKRVRSSRVSAGRAYVLVHSTDARVMNAYDLKVALE